MHNRPYPQAQPRRAPVALIAVATILALLLAAAVLAWLAWQWQQLDQALPGFTLAMRAALPLIIVSLLGWAGAAGILILWRRYGWRESIAASFAVDMMRARTQPAPLATSLHYEMQNALPPAVEQLQLAPPIEVLKPLDEWMRWQDEQPHTLLAGRTKAGKTHLATAILERRLKAGERVFIVDPHSSGWLNLPTAGSVANPKELKFALVALLAEYERRMQARENFKRAHSGAELPHDHFGRMTILIDEANAVAEQQGAVWSTFATQLASGSRKVGFALLILAQSPNVDDIGFSAKMRANFAAIALDMASVQGLIDKERDKARKIALRETTHDLDYPAAAQIGDQVWLLDRSTLPAGRQPAGALSLMWPGWDYTQGRAVSTISGETQAETPLSPTTRIDASVSTTVITPGADVSPVSDVSLTPADVAKIAALLTKHSPSITAKKLDGFNGRNYAEMKAKVDAVVAMMSEVTP